MTVSFDLAAFRVRYPEFASVSDAQLNAFWGEACLYLDPSDASLVADPAQRSLLLNMLVAHIAALSKGADGSAGIVGRINSATEGSVSVGTDSLALPGTAAWYTQTRYGLQYWAATAPYRTWRYVPGYSRNA